MASSQLSPCLAFDGNARQAMQFYQEVLGGTLELMTYGDLDSPEAPGGDVDKVMHSVLHTSDGYTVMAWDVPERVTSRPGNNVALFLGGDDDRLRDHFAALSAGGTVTMPLEAQPWGDEAGSLVDGYGISWMIDISSRPS